MPTVKTELEARLYNALKRISAYTLPEQLRRHAMRHYGVEGAEAIEMAYENVIFEAKGAIKGVRVARPKPTTRALPIPGEEQKA